MKIGQVKITFHNGSTQKRDVVTQESYESVYKVKKSAIQDLESELNKVKDNKSEKYLGISKRIREIKSELSEIFGDNFITDGSPIHDAIKTKTLSLPPQQGGDKPCEVFYI